METITRLLLAYTLLGAAVMADEPAEIRQCLSADSQAIVFQATGDEQLLLAKQDAQDLRRDLIEKALAAPGMFGVYRYLTDSVVKTAVIVVQ